jgi:hypothetical protein
MPSAHLTIGIVNENRIAFDVGHQIVLRIAVTVGFPIKLI